MKIGRILPVVGIATLLACGAAFSQSSPIPPGAGVGVHRQPPGSRASLLSCSQQADAKHLHGKARKAFRSQCKRSGGH